ncbi:MAG: DUF4129 domain-containing protein [Acidobacteria bacterium]|nr:DUF4129 domain-containing protein [Acidobacteriota bacterium]
MMKLRLKSILRRIACAALFVVFCAGLPAAATTATATFTQYRARVHDAIKPLDELATLCERIAKGERYEVWSRGEADKDLPLMFLDAETKTLNKVRLLLPPKEKIEWGGGTADVDNAWLHAALQDYERKSAKGSDNRERAKTIRDIVERLRALEARLDEVALSSDARARDKDAEKGRLSAILRDPDYNQKASQGGALGRLIEQFVEWIRSLFPHIRPIQPGTTPTVSRAAQIFVFALALAVIAYVTRRYWLRLGTSTEKLSLREARVVLGERLAPDQTASDLLSEAERLARGGDLRGAIRKAYIALLCELGDRKVIRLAQHKTNRDYLRAVRQSAPPQLFQEMQPLTSNFERHWYGSEDATETDWTDFRTRCRQALNVR